MYKNVWFDWKKCAIHIWDDKIGYKEMKYVPYVYEKAKRKTKFKNIYDEYVKKITFKTMYDKHNYVKDKKTLLGKNVSKELFEADIPPEMLFLQQYKSHSISNIRKWYIDIEVDSRNGFPEPDEAKEEVTAISIYDTTDKYYICFLLDYRMNQYDKIKTSKNKNKILIQCPNEDSLLNEYKKLYTKIYPDMLLAWNGLGFDYPYLFNRYDNIYGDNTFFSPIGKSYDYFFSFYSGKTSISEKVLRMAGVSTIDMMLLYKKFAWGDRQAFSLEYISQYELGIGKIKYKGNLNDLYYNDIDKFIEYSFRDVELMKMLEDKLGYVNTMRTICHMARIPYEYIFSSSKTIDGAIMNFLKQKNIVMPMVTPNNNKQKFEGAYVQEPQVGFHELIIDLDVTSLYPSIIMLLNISPETKIGKLKYLDDRPEIIMDLAKKNKGHSKLKPI